MANEMKKKDLKIYSLEQLTDEFIGHKGTQERESFEFDLKLEVLGYMIRKVRKEQHLTQEQLGELVGVQKAQISKIENSIKDVRFSTLLRVFEALKAKVNMTVEFDPNSHIYCIGKLR